MPIKDLLHRCQPVQLYIVLALSICYFLLQLILSHITHALTLLMASYHMLCNIIALFGCILTIKHSKRTMSMGCENHSSPTSEQKRCEMALRNTFGWTRIGILTMLIVFIFLASLSFSLLIEAMQTLVHIAHQDTMHLPIPILCLGSVGLALNGLCCLLIGGYTFHQGSFLHFTSGGDVVLDKVITNDDTGLIADQRRMSRTRTKRDRNNKEYFIGIFRDMSSTLFVILCAIIVYFANDQKIAKFIDPIISIISCIVLLALSYPHMEASCLILLQTIPGSINIETFESTLLSKFHGIINYHDLHIWQLTASKYVSTVHILFKNPYDYANIIKDVQDFFREQGITIVTIQPEFECSKLQPIQKSKSTSNLSALELNSQLKKYSSDPQVSIVKDSSDMNMNSLPIISHPVKVTNNIQDCPDENRGK